jgi:3-deoxy-manno-octulosonate cytidylyltransferase (CMP-KDO synthetase)
MNVTAIIPARYASSRLPGKPLLELMGKPMILHVVERARAVKAIGRVIVATDDERILTAVNGAGAEAWMTSPHHQTGTDRLAEVAAQLDSDIIVNVAFLEMATTSEPLDTAEDVLNPNVVKVVTDRAGFACYFSRQPIPFPRADVQAHGSLAAALEARPELLRLYAKHTGLYVYRREFLLRFATLEPTPLERTEALEQLRALEYGYRIRVIPAVHSSLGVDTPEDWEKARRLLRD